MEQASSGNQAVILQAWGRLEEALALLKKQEALCLQLGNRSRLGYCYCNWGLLAREQHDSLQGLRRYSPKSSRAACWYWAASRRYAEIVILRRQAGKPIEAFDALIAATALVAGAAVAKRDIAGFEGCGLTLINPWQAS